MEATYDVTFELEDGQFVYAHRAVLGAVSSQFYLTSTVHWEPVSLDRTRLHRISSILPLGRNDEQEGVFHVARI